MNDLPLKLRWARENLEAVPWKQSQSRPVWLVSHGHLRQRRSQKMSWALFAEEFPIFLGPQVIYWSFAGQPLWFIGLAAITPWEGGVLGGSACHFPWSVCSQDWFMGQLSQTLVSLSGLMAFDCRSWEITSVAVGGSGWSKLEEGRGKEGRRAKAGGGREEEGVGERKMQEGILWHFWACSFSHF